MPDLSYSDPIKSGLMVLQASILALIYPRAQHIVWTCIRGIDLARFPGPRNSTIRGILNANFGELPFYEVE
jgi:hypothetical protein